MRGLTAFDFESMDLSAAYIVGLHYVMQPRCGFHSLHVESSAPLVGFVTMSDSFHITVLVYRKYLSPQL